mmetsp:Transcript_42779/g.70124  ORF Transcript_42779/g.70124 Transcript_42779/m.70124 type:complete len:110 (+) Transcript_42779:873-1202(+)
MDWLPAWNSTPFTHWFSNYGGACSTSLMTFNSGGALQLLVELIFHPADTFCTWWGSFSLLLCCCASYVRCGGALGVQTPFLGVGIVLDHSNPAFGLFWKARTLLVTNDD